MGRCARKILLLIVLLIVVYGAKSQIKNIGVPYIKNYGKGDYNAATQNWDIVQDSRGIMYFANNQGILEFDGTNWRLFPITNFSVPRCLHIDKKQRIWLGSFNDIGYLKVNGKGDFQYHSIAGLIPENNREFGEVWKIYETTNGIYFQSMNSLFLFDGEKIKKIDGYNDYIFSFYVNGRFFVQSKSKGLLELRGKRLYVVEGGHNLVGDVEVWAMLPISPDTILIATQHHGVYLYDGYNIYNNNFKINYFLIEKQIFSAKIIQNKYIAFGTIQSGLIVTDFEGNVIQHIDRKKGLQNNTVLCLFEDRFGHIWLGLDNGIDFVEINSAFTFLNEAYGIEGTGYGAKLFDKTLYLGTNQGLYYKNWDALNKPDIGVATFQYDANLIGQVWSLEEHGGNLLCGHNTGTFQYTGSYFKKISEEKGGWTYIKPDEKKDLLIGGSYFDLSLYKKDRQKQWEFVSVVSDFSESCRLIEKDSLGHLWVSHGAKGVYKLALSEDYKRVVSFKLYNSAHGLPSDFDNFVFKLYNKVIVCASQGIYEYNYKNDTFEKSSFFNQLLGKTTSIRNPQFDTKGNIWFYSNSYPTLLKREEEGWQRIEAPFQKYGAIFVSAFENIEIIDHENILLGTENGFIHLNPSLLDTISKGFSAQIRQVRITKPTDSVINHGHVLKGPMQKNVYPYSMNALKFRFAAPFYESPERSLYRFRLEGFEQSWSQWSNNTEKEYTNIPPGKYAFLVEAKNIYGHKGKGASFSFEISPPWYLTYGAFIVYIVFLVILAFIAYKYLQARFDKAKLALKTREAEKLKKKEEEYAKEKLLDEQKIIKLKNEKLEAEVLQRKTQMELKNKELASVAIQITHKNEILTNLKAKIEAISQKVNTQAQLGLRQLTKTIDEDLKLDRDWDQFKLHFEEVHADFFKRLKSEHDELTPKDLKMCAYLRMNLSTKEIAPLMNISVRGVEISRYRLRKKLGLEKDTNLIEFMLSV